ncbi:hypothetical protein CEP52_010891 [Fusarium oligoseptatum]|uniref:Uncharacterized protein n=2 Tax=Fusarium solani species complex TaxID=232080 RepID=A0A428T5V9_9HYPO|nr:hypothetical protein CEP51_005658 [Fusarium floridanum]RSL97425.1 hypothetical protein CEP52_010891 [Fusarium oligoseptatum]
MAPQQYDTVSRQTDEGPETGSDRENLYASSCTLPRLTYRAADSAAEEGAATNRQTKGAQRDTLTAGSENTAS